VDEGNALAAQFEDNRAHLRAVAYRMLGSVTEADDAVQEAWLRVSRADRSAVQNMGGWQTTIVARICLDMLRARKNRQEEPLAAFPPDQVAGRPDGVDPEHEAVLSDSVGLALLVVLDTLAPAERLAFVLHDMFAVPFEDIAPIVGRSPAATRQLASRARRRVQAPGPGPEADRTRQREVVDAFLAASRGGDFAALLAVLDPDVVLRADPAAVQVGALATARGAVAVAQNFVGRAKAARPALIGGAAGAVWAPGGTPRVAFAFTVVEGRIVEINILADPDRLAELGVTVVEPTRGRESAAPRPRSH
jgi:RNA polymerase sigma factor (sigma-70 family)